MRAGKGPCVLRATTPQRGPHRMAFCGTTPLSGTGGDAFRKETSSRAGSNAPISVPSGTEPPFISHHNSPVAGPRTATPQLAQQLWGGLVRTASKRKRERRRDRRRKRRDERNTRQHQGADDSTRNKFDGSTRLSQGDIDGADSVSMSAKRRGGRVPPGSRRVWVRKSTPPAHVEPPPVLTATPDVLPAILVTLEPTNTTIIPTVETDTTRSDIALDDITLSDDVATALPAEIVYDAVIEPSSDLADTDTACSISLPDSNKDSETAATTVSPKSKRRRRRKSSLKKHNLDDDAPTLVSLGPPQTHHATTDFIVKSPLANNFTVPNCLTDPAVDSGRFIHNTLTIHPSVKTFDQLHLTEGGMRIRDTPNAGGNSVASEVLSFEMLRCMYGAELKRTEMQLDYFPAGGKITDYSIEMYGLHLGVSVTRAMKYQGLFSDEDANALLMKKLVGVNESSRLVMRPKFHKQILHVFAEADYIVDVLQRCYARLDREYTSSTLVVVTVADMERVRWVFHNPPSERPTRRMLRLQRRTALASKH
eukprot:TRINITY_DN3583_c0_g1_i1.p1 TRINITY_DN3583_c0_g1~~TRINITY_DN3583_c0_g1_i1.p1  ORF type:complete len:536 (+),score=65.45 TRINITY_DN3583_c0_g1_i1:672-2279(+)